MAQDNNGRTALYKELGHDTPKDIQQPDSFKVGYIDNDNNSRVKNKALADKSLDEFIEKIPREKILSKASKVSN